MDARNPKYDRLKLTKERIDSIATDMEHVAGLPVPYGKVIQEMLRPNGMKIQKVTVPFGVVGIIYEARPNVTFDVFSLCLRSGNVCVLKGGSDAEMSNRALVGIIHDVLLRNGINPAVCTLLPSSREATDMMLHAVGLVDLIIPRGSASLISFVRENARVPVIETGAGVCHAYFDKEGDKEKGQAIVNNAKTRRVSVCNALDCLLIHRDRLLDLPYICRKLADSCVVIYADGPSYDSLSGFYPAELLQNIACFGSKHSECIISESAEDIALFQQAVDAACVYANVSTAFTDGAQFGFGAEIGISTQKLHARGPMALPELTTYKYLISGNGQIRNQ